ncbi:hypothetical protein ACWDUX_10810 [Streptomyces sp. NPDC003444]|uniref:hypothetical protein n=1 Tax=Streptomyces TaxID=1883 RepID=UPI001F0AE812|nr:MULTISPECIES: hypothetical protein [unclassified Streptomyces]
MAELAGYARFRDAMERAHPAPSEAAHPAFPESARPEREPAAAATAVTPSSSG